MTNAKHAVAAAATADLVAQLQADIAATLDRLLTLDGQLEDLADTRQAIGLGFTTPDALARRARQDAADRAAARGTTHRDTRVGLAWMNPALIAATGQTEAPVTMPTVAASAQIRFTLQHHVRRLAKTARAALATAPRPHTYAVHRIAAARLDVDDQGARQLADRLAALVAIYTSRPGLQAILRDLEHLERTASDILDGPAKTNHPSPCPWCGRHSLVIHHRDPGRDAAYIRCEGRHPCTCADEWCPCQRPPSPNRAPYRHEWINSRHSSNNWSRLVRDQDHREEEMALERAARDTLDQIRALHPKTPLYPVVDECDAPHEHSEAGGWTGDPETGEAICTACPPAAHACGSCRDADGWYHPWPCPTAEALGDDDTTSAGADQ